MKSRATPAGGDGHQFETNSRMRLVVEKWSRPAAPDANLPVIDDTDSKIARACMGIRKCSRHTNRRRVDSRRRAPRLALVVRCQVGPSKFAEVARHRQSWSMAIALLIAGTAPGFFGTEGTPDRGGQPDVAKNPPRGSPASQANTASVRELPRIRLKHQCSGSPAYVESRWATAVDGQANDELGAGSGPSLSAVMCRRKYDKHLLHAGQCPDRRPSVTRRPLGGTDRRCAATTGAIPAPSSTR